MKFADEYKSCRHEQQIRCISKCDEARRNECKNYLQKQKISDDIFALLKGQKISVSAMIEILEEVQTKILSYSTI